LPISAAGVAPYYRTMRAVGIAVKTFLAAYQAPAKA